MGEAENKICMVLCVIFWLEDDSGWLRRVKCLEYLFILSSERHGFMKLSARNQFAGKVVEITEGATNGIVKIEIAPEVVISASITNESIKELGLKVGETAYAVIKASNVMVGADD